MAKGFILRYSHTYSTGSIQGSIRREEIVITFKRSFLQNNRCTMFARCAEAGQTIIRDGGESGGKRILRKAFTASRNEACMQTK